MTKIKLIAGGLAGLALVLAVGGGVWWVRSIMAESDKRLARAEAAEAKVAELAEANASLKEANSACNVAALAQSAAGIAALARRETLDEIMTCPASEPTAGPEPKGEPLNDAQDRKMVDFWNRDVFAGLGGVRP